MPRSFAVPRICPWRIIAHEKCSPSQWHERSRMDTPFVRVFAWVIGSTSAGRAAGIIHVDLELTVSFGSPWQRTQRNN